MNRHLLLSTFFLLFFSAITFSQNSLPANGCGTGAPGDQWDKWFNEQLEAYKEKISTGKVAAPADQSIPVVVHIIFFNEPIGTFPNIDSNQVKSQIQALNDDFAGTGFNSQNVPSYFAGLKANTGIHFCLAKKDPSGTVLLERGIHRVSASALSWLSPNTPTLNLQNYFNTVIIPNTIWDPTKYLNIWISDKPPTYPLNGFATYPPASGLPGIFGTNFGTTGNDGIWIWTKAFGTQGTLQSPYDKGRNLTHEVGHWLGLRHTWGDGNCLSDYASDTPPSKQPHYGCLTSTPADLCGVNQSPNGEMTMNFMDRSDDACMYMFTYEQALRMKTALSQSPLRQLLGTHDVCTYVPPTVTTSSAVAKFTVPQNQCVNAPFTPSNMSTGYPYPTYVWNVTPAALIQPNSSAVNPAIVLQNPGTYTLSLVATNSLAFSSWSMVVSANGTCEPQSFCLDTVKMIRNLDTLTRYSAPASSVLNCNNGPTGYLTGTSCYKDKEIAQYFPPNTFTSTPNPQVNSVIVLFDSTGTKANFPQTQIACKIYGGTSQQGPVGVIGQKSDSLGKIIKGTAVPSVGYIGKPNTPLVTNTKIIPFKFDFQTPVVLNVTGGFFAGITLPVNSPQDSITVVSNTEFNNTIDSSAWYLQFSNSWRTYRYGRGHKIQLAIMPQITCSPISGIAEQKNSFASNVTLVPNPNNGLFNVVFTLPQGQDVRIRVFNAVGQEIVDSSLDHVMNNVIQVDLSHQPEGVYFTEISNGTERVLKKTIVTH